MLRRYSLTLALVALASAPLAWTACGGLDDTEENALPVVCNADSDCTAGTEICHPVGFVCVKTCTAATDCTGTGETCADVADSTGTVKGKICKCGTTTCSAVTVDGGTNNQVCSSIDNLCENRCAQDSDCGDFFPQTRKCNTTKGQCEPSTASGCTSDSQCTSATAARCNTSSGQCEACTTDTQCAHIGSGLKCDSSGACVSQGTTCNANVLLPGTNGGPDTCAYGEVCVGATCSASLPDGTCATTMGSSWNTSPLGPVIFVADGQSFASNATYCAGGAGGFTVDVEFYSVHGISKGTWSENVQQVQFYRKSDHRKSDAGIIVDFPEDGAKHGSFKTGMCGSAAGAIDPTGYALYMIDSNGGGGNLVCL
ncbi:MAG: hypothetical protein HY901_02855 [Deltaproteobacteria bacterium]|nr:hypothetical protein [Deltaproteobacteria bacterium]